MRSRLFAGGTQAALPSPRCTLALFADPSRFATRCSTIGRALLVWRECQHVECSQIQSFGPKPYHRRGGTSPPPWEDRSSSFDHPQTRPSSLHRAAGPRTTRPGVGLRLSHSRASARVPAVHSFQLDPAKRQRSMSKLRLVRRLQPGSRSSGRMVAVIVHCHWHRGFLLSPIRLHEGTECLSQGECGEASPPPKLPACGEAPAASGFAISRAGVIVRQLPDLFHRSGALS